MKIENSNYKRYRKFIVHCDIQSYDYSKVILVTTGYLRVSKVLFDTQYFSSLQSTSKGFAWNHSYGIPYQ